MDVKVKYLVTATMNCSRVTGGPYVDGVKGKTDIMELDYAENLQERGKLEITDHNVAPNEQSNEDKIKDALMAQAKDLEGVKLTRTMKVDTMIKHIKDAGAVPDLGEAQTKDSDENQE